MKRDSMSEVALKGSVRWSGFGQTPENNHARILVVDDNDALRYSLVRALREAGFEVLEARTGNEALALAENSPDLITLDVNLPDIDGYQVCQRLKKASATSHIPILHISATCIDPEARVRGLEGGADAYLSEPIDRAELIATIGALLRLKNAEAQARQQAEAAESARRESAQLNSTLEKGVQERTAELQTANESLRQLSARLLQMQDEERRRIARELHDSVGQLLAAIAMNNATIAGDSSKLGSAALKALNENESMVREVLRGIRTMSHLLHPPLLDEAGLPAALQWYVDEFSERSGIEVALRYPPALERLPADLETTLFRIVQECLGNVHRHSESPTAAISLEIKDGRARLEVSDQGVGIPAERQRELKAGGRTGVGLRGMRERIAQLGGDLEIQSNDRGTSVIATLPCVPLAKEADVA